MKRVASEHREPAKTTEQFIRLYDFKSDAPAVEISQFGFDYSFLGDRMALSAAANISSTVNALRRFFSRSAFDDRLAAGFVPATGGISGTDPVEAASLLLVRYYRSLARYE